MARRRRFPLAARFWLALTVLVAAMAAVAAVAIAGLHELRASADGMHQRVLSSVEQGEGRFHLGSMRTNLQLYALTRDPAQRRMLHERIETDILHAEEYARESLTASEDLAQDTAAGLWHSGAFDGPGAARAARRAEQALGPIVDGSDAHVEEHIAAAAAARKHADAAFDSTRTRLIAALLGALAIVVAMVFWLVHTVAARARDYALFARRVSAGEVGSRLAPKGRDELADLGRTLDSLVGDHENERSYQATQHEFVDALQVTASEDEAHELLKRHLERSVADSVVVVLNRNNSDDRLEPVTDVPAGSALSGRLEGASPRSCLAVRAARRHEQGGDAEPLLSCELCGKTAEQTTCDPLLVGGEVIGSVLVEHGAALEAQEDKRLRDSVSQAAPVLANLRNLAVAELRASTDALTGLPNKRAAVDTLKRMVAQATRGERSLSAVLLDLDHFKKINDTFGHGRGDDVLAAAAEAMRSPLRESDFVARYGGEEFLILLPDTDGDGATNVAEKVRAAISGVAVPNVEREITASLGVAVLGQDGIDGDTLMRSADRALYAAKSLGRNRVACAGAIPSSTPA